MRKKQQQAWHEKFGPSCHHTVLPPWFLFSSISGFVTCPCFISFLSIPQTTSTAPLVLTYQILAIAFLLPGLLILPCPVTANLGIKAKIPLVSTWEGIWPLLHIRWCFAGQELKFYKPHSWAPYNFVRDHCYLGGGNKSISIFKLEVINYSDNLSWNSFQIKKKKAHLRFFIYSILQHCSFT